MERKYKTYWYIPHSKYTFSIYDENDELIYSCDRYRSVANYLGIKEQSVIEQFSRIDKNTISVRINKAYGKVTRVRNEGDEYRYE